MMIFYEWCKMCNYNHFTIFITAVRSQILRVKQSDKQKQNLKVQWPVPLHEIGDGS